MLRFQHARSLARALKGRAGPSIRRLCHLSGASTLLARRQRALRVIKFQGVGDAEYPTRAFREQLLHLRRHFRVVPLADLLAKIPRFEGDGRVVALTFDDGQRNNCTEAYPVLRELGLPATFFVCPGAIEHQRWIWTQEARLRLDWLSAGARRELAQSWSTGDDSEAMLERLKAMPTDERIQRVDDLRAASRAFVPTPEQRAYYDIMRWDELRALDPRLVTIGSHTISHPVLTRCSRAAQAEEIRESRRWLEREVGRAVRFFSYPCGAHDAGVVQLVAQVYDAALAGTGLVRQGADRFTVPRVPFAPDLPLMAWRMLRPGS